MIKIITDWLTPTGASKYKYKCIQIHVFNKILKRVKKHRWPSGLGNRLIIVFR